MDPDELCRALAEELNVKAVAWATPFSADGRPVLVRWEAGGGLDVWLGDDAQGKPGLARRLFDRLVRPALAQWAAGRLRLDAPPAGR